jgi:hypothetical protein
MFTRSMVSLARKGPVCVCVGWGGLQGSYMSVCFKGVRFALDAALIRYLWALFSVK